MRKKPEIDFVASKRLRIQKTSTGKNDIVLNLLASTLWLSSFKEKQKNVMFILSRGKCEKLHPILVSKLSRTLCLLKDSSKINRMQKVDGKIKRNDNFEVEYFKEDLKSRIGTLFVLMGSIIKICYIF